MVLISWSRLKRRPQRQALGTLVVLHRRRHRDIGWHARYDRVGDGQRIEPAHLFGDRAIERRVARMYAGHAPACRMRVCHQRHDRVQIERCRVDRLDARFAFGDDLGRHERARIEHKIGRLDRAQAAQRDQIGRSGPGTDEVDAQDVSFFS